MTIKKAKIQWSTLKKRVGQLKIRKTINIVKQNVYLGFSGMPRSNLTSILGYLHSVMVQTCRLLELAAYQQYH